MSWASQSNRRLRALLWLLAAWAVVIVARLVFLQVYQHDEFVRLAEQQQQKIIELPAVRGSILDRNGQPLAKTLLVESICINPRKTGSDPATAAMLLSRVLDMNYRDLLAKITQAKAQKLGFLWIKRNVKPDEAKRARSMSLEWLETRIEAQRFYPQGALASHVVGTFGMVSTDDQGERGNSGLEQSLEDELAGRPGKARVYFDVKQNPYRQEQVREPQAGTTITTTIDPSLQYDAQQALNKAARDSNSTFGSLVALNPANGEILAMANYPSFDPTLPSKHGEGISARRNTAVSAPFEPGSVFKVITLAAALDSTDLKPETIINCGMATLTLRGRKFTEHGSHGNLSMADVLARSSNLGAIQIALHVGEPKFYDYIRRFGFGRKTGIELPGESAGILRPLKQWQPASIGSIAMGHEIGATSLQLALAGAVIANGGILVKPRLVLSRQHADGRPIPYTTEPGTRIIKPETAIKMRAMMEGVVLHGTGRQAILRGYTSGGKTGSAMIFDTKTKMYVRHYNASFVGFAPVANPQIVIAVTLINTPTGEAGFGGAVAAPVFKEVASSALRLMEVPKDIPDSPNLAAAKVPNYDDSTEGAAEALLAEPSKEAEQPTPAAPVTSAKTGAPVPGVPDLRGMTMRAVLEESAAKGMEVEVVGDGVARAQQPAPGTPLEAGTRIKVVFAR